jgi:hypothetical protein
VLMGLPWRRPDYRRREDLFGEKPQLTEAAARGGEANAVLNSEQHGKGDKNC